MYGEHNITRIQISRKQVDFFWDDNFSTSCSSTENAILKRGAIGGNSSELMVTLIEVIK